MTQDEGGAPVLPPSARRRPGRPRKDTLRRLELRKEHQNKQKQTPIFVDDLEFGKTQVPIHFFARGKVIKRYQTCGKKGCACQKGPRYQHGPYYYLVVTNPKHSKNPNEPKQKWFYLTQEEADRIRKRITNFNLLSQSLFSDVFDEMSAGKE
jgi:hypothetical protein